MNCLWVFINIFLVTSTSIGVGHGAEKVVKVNSFDWSYVISQEESSLTSSLTIKLMANIARRCDSVSGKNLWKVGVFGSESQDGSGERYGYVEQILNKKQTCKTVKKGSVFRLRDLRTRFDVDGVSCGNASFLCVELAKNSDSSVNFELRYGGLVNSVVACKPFECTDPSIAATGRNDLPSICFNPCPAEDVSSGVVCGNNSVEYDNLCVLKKAAHCEKVPVALDNLGNCARKEIVVFSSSWTYEVSRNPDNSSLPLLENELNVINIGDDVSGNELWQVSLFRSANLSGNGTRQNYQEQVLNSEVSSQSIDDSLDFVVPFKAYAIGCEESPYLCYEFRRNPNASVDFELRENVGKAAPISECRHFPCSQIHYKAQLFFSFVRAIMTLSNFRPGGSTKLMIIISLGVHSSSDKVIRGRNMWQLSVYGSRNEYGIEPEKLGYTSVALRSHGTNYSPDIIPGKTIYFIVSTELDGSGIGCGDYSYICIELERNPNSEPDFEIRRCGNRRRIVSCRRSFCMDSFRSLLRG